MIEAAVDADPFDACADAFRCHTCEENARLCDDVAPRLDDGGDVAAAQKRSGDIAQCSAILRDRKLGVRGEIGCRDSSAEVEVAQMRKGWCEREETACGLDERRDVIDTRSDVRVQTDDSSPAVFNEHACGLD